MVCREVNQLESVENDPVIMGVVGVGVWVEIYLLVKGVPCHWSKDACLRLCVNCGE